MSSMNLKAGEMCTILRKTRYWDVYRQQTPIKIRCKTRHSQRENYLSFNLNENIGLCV